MQVHYIESFYNIWMINKILWQKKKNTNIFYKQSDCILWWLVTDFYDLIQLLWDWDGGVVTNSYIWIAGISWPTLDNLYQMCETGFVRIDQCHGEVKVNFCHSFDCNMKRRGAETHSTFTVKIILRFTHQTHCSKWFIF